MRFPFCFFAAEIKNGNIILTISTEKGLAHPPGSPDLDGKGLFHLTANALAFRHHVFSSSSTVVYTAT